MPTLLHVGCGPLTKAATTPGFNLPEWAELRLDIDEAVKPDIIGTMTDMSAVPDASVDGLFSSHNIEHLYAHEVPTALAEFRRVLRADGYAVITCPDLYAVAAHIVADGPARAIYNSEAGPITAHDILYGHGEPMARGNLFMAHRCGFTLQTLADALFAAGFAHVTGIRRRKFLDLWMVATKGAVGEAGLAALAAAHFPPLPPAPSAATPAA